MTQTIHLAASLDTFKTRQADRSLSTGGRAKALLGENQMIGGLLAGLGLATAMVGKMELWLPLAALALLWSVAVEANLSR